MKYKHTNRPGFLLGFIDFFTAGLFFLFYMPHGLQDELEEILGHRVMPYWKAYLLGIPSLFIYPLIWMGRIADELKTLNQIEKKVNQQEYERKYLFPGQTK